MKQDTPITVLLIEDNPTDVGLVQEILRGTPSDHFTIISASTLAQGLERLSSEYVDVILLDLDLPDSQGFDTFQAVEERATDLPIIILTVPANEDLGFKALHAGAQRFVLKDMFTPNSAYAEMFPQVIRYSIEHKRTEAALKQLSDKNERQIHMFDVMLSSLLDPIYLLDTHERFVYVCPQCEQMFGVPREMLTGKTWQEANLSPALMKQLHRHFETVLSVGTTVTASMNIDMLDGTKNYEYTLSPVFDADKNIEGVVLSTHDVTERMRGEAELKQAHERVQMLNKELQSMTEELHVANEALEQRVENRTKELAAATESLKESETRYRRLVERSFDATFIHSDGVVRFVNETAARALKAAAPDALVGMNVLDLPTPRHREFIKGRITSVYERGQSTEPAEIQLCACDGTTIDAEIFSTLITYGGKPAIYVVFRDISKRKRMEAQLKEYAERLEDLVEERTARLKEAERLAAIGQTATMVGHDLRNPLQALMYTLYLENTYFDAIPPEIKAHLNTGKAKQLLTSMEQQIQYMDKIVSDLQDYARPLQVESVDMYVTAFVTDTLALMTIPTSVSVRVDVAGSIKVTADPHLIQRMLTNLILNAVQAMPNGGELSISAAAQSGAVLIMIRDTGEGVPDNMKDTLFSPLTTGKAKGTGLGLAVVKRIVEAHNGTITFESEKGKGTTFTVTLPQTAE